jgi:7-cyano-7-deazaguanine reductase
VTDLNASPLGHATTYAERYDPKLLFPVERAELRSELGLSPPLPFGGVDLWTAYELSWLDADGRPQVAIATFEVPADSPSIVESKSVKLYLVALNQTRYASPEAVRATIAADLSAATGAPVAVNLVAPDGFGALPHGELTGTSLDTLPLVETHDAPAPERLTTHGADAEETLCTRLFRSVCPVTGQPDYASVQVRYRGPRIDAEALLAYLVSYRRHPGFHEHCVERIFTDLWLRCTPQALAVYARFTRRGGVDINPFRANGFDPPAASVRTARQ